MSDITMNDQLLQAFLFEMSALLDRLDDLLLASEESGELAQDDVAEIFRIMHTIKGSSSMMEYQAISTLTHRLEDVFAQIRDNGVPAQLFAELMDLMLSATNFLKSQLEAIQSGSPLSAENGLLLNSATAFLEKLNTGSSQPPDELRSDVDGLLEFGAAEDAADSAAGGLFRIEVMFEEDCGMENLRAFMLVTALRPHCAVLQMDPPDIESNPASASQIVINGFSLVVRTQLDQAQLEELVTQALYVKFAVVTPLKSEAECEEPQLPLQDGTAYQAVVWFEKDCGMENLRAFMLLQHLHPVCHVVKHTPGDVETNAESSADIVKSGFQLELITALSPEQLHELLLSGLYVASATVTQRQASREGVGNEQGVQDLSAHDADESQTRSASGKPVKQDLINVSLSKLDELMDLVGELVITESMVIHNPALSELTSHEGFQKNARRLMKLTDELQDLVMAIRMVPVESTFHRMHRIVRDMCRSLNKDARLVTAGEDTDIDKTIIDTIADPIMHLVRNCMDHGVESPEERQAAGKSPKATITLSAQNTGGEILIVVSDDGRGLDAQALLESARKKGLLYKPAEEYKEKEAFLLLCAPGFSTRDEVTEYSGRGVGLDVVKQNIEKIGGTISIDSEKGQGMTVTLKIPLTLAIVDGMEVSVGDSTLTIPITSINESFKATPDQLFVDTDGNEMIMVRGSVYPILRMHKLYGIQNALEQLEDGILVWVQSDDQSACLFVDDLVGEQQIVVKPLPPYLVRFGVKNIGISACTILGNGSISLILDVGKLIDSTMERR